MFLVETDHAKNNSKLCLMVHTYNPSYLEGRGKKLTSLRTAQAKVARPLFQKEN
jgi:hypothetical protein